MVNELTILYFKLIRSHDVFDEAITIHQFEIPIFFVCAGQWRMLSTIHSACFDGWLIASATLVPTHRTALALKPTFQW